jgi:hypothetical protein
MEVIDEMRRGCLLLVSSKDAIDETKRGFPLIVLPITPRKRN